MTKGSDQEGMYPTAVTQKVYKLGNPYLHTFLVKGQDCALIEAGISSSARQVIEQLQQMEIPPENIRYLLVGHAHFDHATGIPTLKKAFPHLQVLARPYAAQLLAKPKVFASFMQEEVPMVQRLAQKGYRAQHLIDPAHSPCAQQSIAVDRVMEDGDLLELGGDCTLRLIATPGHSPCSMAVYLEQEQVLFPSDCTGYPVKPGYVWPVYFYSYEEYVTSLKKLQQLDVQVVAGPHEMIVYGGENCTLHLKQAELEAIKLREAIIQDFKQGVSREEISARLFASHYINGLTNLSEDNIKGCMDLLVRRSLET
ncbi:MAG TPA: MBL fold metallo-hydrolase [Bacillota bacterium]|nr:MBL fold metallo-hydrolase [Bacillota bacterium]